MIFISAFRYDHLSTCLTKILDERPENVVDVFEDISNHTKRAKFTSNVDTVQDKIDQSTEVALAQVQRKLFAVRPCFSISNAVKDK
jgi:radial spoke head protein 4A